MAWADGCSANRVQATFGRRKICQIILRVEDDESSRMSRVQPATLVNKKGKCIFSFDLVQDVAEQGFENVT